MPSALSAIDRVREIPLFVAGERHDRHFLVYFRIRHVTDQVTDKAALFLLYAPLRQLNKKFSI
jgi:hypothetical protein